MSMSGIEVDSAVTPFFNTMKLKQTHKYALFKIEGKKTVILDEDILGPPIKTETTEEDKTQFEDLKSKLVNEPRYILYDFGFKTKDGRKVGKLVFIFWCPDDGKIGDKMIYASTKDTVKKAFEGVGIELQANDKSDFDYDSFKTEVERKG